MQGFVIQRKAKTPSYFYYYLFFTLPIRKYKKLINVPLTVYILLSFIRMNWDSLQTHFTVNLYLNLYEVYRKYFSSSVVVCESEMLNYFRNVQEWWPNNSYRLYDNVNCDYYIVKCLDCVYVCVSHHVIITEHFNVMVTHTLWHTHTS